MFNIFPFISNLLFHRILPYLVNKLFLILFNLINILATKPSSTIIPSNDPSNYRNSSSSGVIIAIAITVSILVVIVSGLLVFLKLNAKRRSNIYKYAISFQNKLINEKEKQSVTDTTVEMLDLKNPQFRITQNRLSNGYF